MKKFWVVLIAAALVAGFSLSASAADVKFSGSYYAAGAYAKNWAINDEDASGAVYAQRLRIGTEFKIAEGLTLNTRFDALEGRWGQYGYTGTALDRQGTGPSATDRDADDNNISFDRAWVSFAVPFGKFDVGRQDQNSWGTVFASDSFDADAIRYTGNFGPVEVGAFLEKITEGTGDADYNNVNSQGGGNDSDRDNYGIYGKFKWNGGVAGLQIAYTVDNTETLNGMLTTAQANATQFRAKVWTASPYFQATFGPVFVEAEVNYAYGKAESDTNFDDVDVRAWNGYVHAKGNVGPAYLGGFYAYVSGQDWGEDDKITGSNAFNALNNSGYRSGLPTGGANFDPCLILWGAYTNKWLGDSTARATSLGSYGQQTGAVMENAHLVQLYGGIKPMPKMDIKARVSYASADHTPDGYSGHEYGTEIDLTASYKIYDNLTYTVGAGYLFAGDYWKGANEDNDIDDVYVLMHNLVLSF